MTTTYKAAKSTKQIKSPNFKIGNRWISARISRFGTIRVTAYNSNFIY